jgi:predicted transcriptional regulator
MTTREALQQLVDELPEDQAELAHAWLQDLSAAADEDGPQLDPEALASLDRGLADLAAGRVKPLAEYERERGL